MNKKEKRRNIIPGGLVLLMCLISVACGQKKQQEENFNLSVSSEEGVVPDVYIENTQMSWQGSRDLLSYPTDKTAEELLDMTKNGSLGADFVVMEDSEITSGEDIWEAFFERTREGLSAQVQIAYYYTLDKETNGHPKNGCSFYVM